MAGSPYSVLQCCLAFDRTLVKQRLQNNSLFARLISKDNLKFKYLQDARQNSTIANDDWNALEYCTLASGHHGGYGLDYAQSKFYDNIFGCAEHDTSDSNVLRVVYGEHHVGLVDDFLQVTIGFAGLDTPVPQMVHDDPCSTDWEAYHSGQECKVVEYRPLQI